MSRRHAAADKPRERQEAEGASDEARDPLLDAHEAPPLAGKVHPREDMDAMTPTLDDEHRRYHHHPNDAGSTEFGVDPDVADAAADLAGDLGSAFLSGATRGEDMSDLALTEDERGDDELPLLLDENADEPVDDDALPPRRRQRVRRV